MKKVRMFYIKAMTVSDPLLRENPFEFSSRYEALRQLESLKKELPHFKEYKFQIKEFTKEVDEITFAGFVYPNGEFVYVPYMQHDNWVRDVYGKSKDDFMFENKCCEITVNSTDKKRKIIILPFDPTTYRQIMLTEEQAKTILDMDLPLTILAREMVYEVLGE